MYGCAYRRESDARPIEVVGQWSDAGERPDSDLISNGGVISLPFAAPPPLRSSCLRPS